MLSLIYARSENYCIGRSGRVPWHLPDEYAHFKRITLHKPIIMGRRTYEDHQTLLPDRLNIVVTSRPDYRAVSGVRVVATLEAALMLGYQACSEVFVVGGVGLFESCFEQAERVYETVVHTVIEAGDSFVPRFDFSAFAQEVLEEHGVDERHAFAYTAFRYERCRVS